MNVDQITCEDALKIAVRVLSHEYVSSQNRMRAIVRIEQMIAQRGAREIDRACDDDRMTTLCDIFIDG